MTAPDSAHIEKRREATLTVLIAERVRELHALALGRRLDGSAMEQLRQEYAALCDAWLAAHETDEQGIPLDKRAHQIDDGWRPIETAPRDGSAVLLCWAIDADGDPIDWNNEPTTAGVFVQVASWSEVEDRWWVYISTPSDAALHFKPTHWRPLPAPPNTREGEAP